MCISVHFTLWCFQSGVLVFGLPITCIAVQGPYFGAITDCVYPFSSPLSLTSQLVSCSFSAALACFHDTSRFLRVSFAQVHIYVCLRSYFGYPVSFRHHTACDCDCHRTSSHSLFSTCVGKHRHRFGCMIASMQYFLSLSHCSFVSMSSVFQDCYVTFTIILHFYPSYASFSISCQCFLALRPTSSQFASLHTHSLMS